jgi:phage shock protein A
MIPVASLDPAWTALAGAILTGGPVYAAVSYKKAGPENESLAARTLIEVNEELRKELDRRDRIIDSLEKRMGHMRREIESLEHDIAALRTSSIP